MINNLCINVFIGSSGLIASALKSTFYQKNNHFISKDDLDLADFNFDQSEIINKFKNKTINIFLISGIKKQFGDNQMIFKKNLNLIINFLNFISNLNVKKITYISSTEIYGFHKKKINEQTESHTTSYYGISKILSEKFIINYCKKKKIKYLILRLPQVYGPKDFKNAYGPTYFASKIKKNQNIYLWGNGKEKREFIFVNDVALIVKKLSNKKINHILNLVSGNSVSYSDLINVLDPQKQIRLINKKRTGKKYDVIYDNSLLKKYIGQFQFTCISQLKSIYNLR